MEQSDKSFFHHSSQVVPYFGDLWEEIGKKSFFVCFQFCFARVVLLFKIHERTNPATGKSPTAEFQSTMRNHK